MPGFRSQDTVNLYLAEVNAKARSPLYVLDTRAGRARREQLERGRSLSEWTLAIVLTCATRWIVARALHGIGTTSGKAGFYYSQVRDHEVVVVSQSSR